MGLTSAILRLPLVLFTNIWRASLSGFTTVFSVLLRPAFLWILVLFGIGGLFMMELSLKDDVVALELQMSNVRNSHVHGASSSCSGDMNTLIQHLQVDQ